MTDGDLKTGVHLEEGTSEGQLLGAGSQQKAMTFRPIAKGTEFCHKREPFSSEFLETSPAS